MRSVFWSPFPFYSLTCFSVDTTPVSKREDLLIDLTTSPKETKENCDKSHRSSLNIFDSLCSTNDVLYGNVELPKPLFSCADTDPFAVDPRILLLANNNTIKWNSTEDSGFRSNTDSVGGFNSNADIFNSPAVLRKPSLPSSSSSQKQIYRSSVPNSASHSLQSSPSLLPKHSPGLSFLGGGDALNKNTSANCGGLLYCEPPADDVQYKPPSHLSLGGAANAFSNQGTKFSPSHLPNSSSSLEHNHTAAGLNPSFKEHLQNVVFAGAANTRCKSVNLPPHTTPLTPTETKSAPTSSQNPFHTHSVLKPSVKPTLINSNSQDIDKIKTEKAFDWLNEALKSNLTIQSQRIMNKDFQIVSDMSQKDQNPISKTQKLPLYDAVPDESDSSSEFSTAVKQEQRYSGTIFGAGSQYSNVSTTQDMYTTKMSAFANSNGGQVYMEGDNNYACSSNFSDTTWDDDFDEDFDDTSLKDLDLEDSSKPPPLPPRTYPTAASITRDKTFSEKPYILPLKQDGQQLSHTHYFLIPSINEQDASLHRREKSPPQKSTAAVRPFLVNSAFDNSDEKSNTRDYQNITGLMSRDVIQRSMSNMSTSSSSKSSCSGSVETSPRRQLQQSHSSGKWSPSKPRPIQAHRKTAEEEKGQFMGSSPRDRIAVVQSKVMGVTDDECYTALSTTHWDIESAVRYLKVEQLFRLGVASRPSCHKLLENFNWNLEQASSVIIDSMNPNPKKGRIESTV